MSKPKFVLGGGWKYKIKISAEFQRCYARSVRQGKDMRKLMRVVRKLANGESLPARQYDHMLRDNKQYRDCRECHISPDWLLIYKYDHDELVLALMRLGSHADLF